MRGDAGAGYGEQPPFGYPPAGPDGYSDAPGGYPPGRPQQPRQPDYGGFPPAQDWQPGEEDRHPSGPQAPGPYPADPHDPHGYGRNRYEGGYEDGRFI
jgi:hypothetical protein